ncbi:PREDICTED: 5'-nucleotidase domain-containing protein 1-like isoform X1 [Trachymyrmex septentrionalis]|uniref:5'-nucleotidase domain-containing protein 1-like isoform X1 n=1 Tax=Trachymyrmex septentrionalis TaxID=34720 RepID=UPI00084F04D9|nr:PREDICTED: 5'-nucleotidase domain-containing protein 1-like isoform X1 [Trachymyrmex septentrionalis]
MIRNLSFYRTVKLYKHRHSSIRKQVKQVTDKIEIFPGTTMCSISNDRYGYACGNPAKSDMDAFKFTNYDCIGFDLDNTLLRYNVTNLVCMEYEMLARYLVEIRGYNENLLKPLTDDDLDFMQKGLLLDMERGNVLRISPDGVIRRACHDTDYPSYQATIKSTKPTCLER